MMYKVKVAVCSQTRTKYTTQSEHHVEFMNVKPGGRCRNRQDLKGSNFLSKKQPDHLQRISGVHAMTVNRPGHEADYNSAECRA
jgi:hypothetical protein